MLSSTTLKPFTPQQKHFGPSFKGDKDIVVIDDDNMVLYATKHNVKKALGDEYNIHEALGGPAGLNAVKEFKPKLTITAFHMPEYGSPYKEDLIRELKKLNTHIIVHTNNWFEEGKKSRIEGVNTCENLCKADKYVSKRDPDIFIDSVKAIINGEEPPRYDFQKDPLTEFGKKIKDISGKLKGLISHKNKT